eukprot:3239362-Amphidinium_carterae.1
MRATLHHNAFLGGTTFVLELHLSWLSRKQQALLKSLCGQRCLQRRSQSSRLSVPSHGLLAVVFLAGQENQQSTTA